MARQYQQGTYDVQNKDKYIGAKNPRYLSSYELAVFQFCDRSPNVIECGSETTIVKYYNPVKQRLARYIVDIYIKYKDKAGNIHEELIEIKPKAQCKPPTKGRKRKDVYEQEVLTWMVNQAKWEEASKYADQRGMKFRILTEDSIFR
jgi:hypothetical protein